MLLLIPVASRERDAMITMIAEREAWALVEADGGGVVDVTFYDDRHAIEDFIDTVIVMDKNDEVAPFFEESLPVLETPVPMNIDDIVEAYNFKELYEVPIRF